MKIPQLFSKMISSKGSSNCSARVHFWRSGETNLGYFLQSKDSDQVICVDVPDGDQVLTLLKAKGWKLSALLLTHDHHDHVNGLEQVVKKTGCAFYASKPFSDLSRLHVSDHLEWEIEGFKVVALDTSGHIDSHFSYLFPELSLCFCADCLFQWGCGRMFTGPKELFWTSILRLRSLPDETLMCCGHDFRKDNLAFIQNELSGWSEAQAIASQIQQSMQSDSVHEPFLIGEQKRTNPFLRADDPDLAQVVGRAGKKPEEVFAELRKRRNAY